MPANECIPLFRGGWDDITGHASAAIVGRRFVKVSGNVQAGPELNTSTSGGNIQVAHATAAGAALGVSAHDAGSGTKVAVIRQGNIVPVESSGAIAADAGVEVGANGVAVTLASGVRVGRAVSAAANNIVYVEIGG